MPAHSLNVDGVNMVYSVVGEESAPPLIMLHGWGSFRGVWRTTIPELQKHYRCITVDLIGFGDSDIPRDPDVKISTQAQRIKTLIDALEYDKVTLFGHSMGGQIALYLASQLIPDRIEKLVNVAGVSHAKLTPAAESELRGMKLAQYVPLYLTLARFWCHTRLYARMYCSHWFHNLDCVPLDFWREDRYRTLQPKAHRSLYPAWEAITSCDLTEHLSQITAPTLTIFGKQDNVVPVEAGHVADKTIPNHKLVLIDECGHFSMYEQRDMYLKVVTEFLGNKING